MRETWLEEIDYDLEWDSIIAVSCLDDRALVALFSQLSMNLVQMVSDDEMKSMYLMTKSEILVRLESQKGKGV